MPTYQDFTGIESIEEGTLERTLAEALVVNELGGVSDGYQMDHANTENSGYSFGANQMDIGTNPKDGEARNRDARDLFKGIIVNQQGQAFFDSIKDRAYQNGNPNALTQQEIDIINNSFRSDYGKEKINQSFVEEVNHIISHVGDVEQKLNTNLSYDVKVALGDYHNQFNLDTDLSKSVNMISKLKKILNETGTITLNDVENSIRSTGYYVKLANDGKIMKILPTYYQGE